MVVVTGAWSKQGSGLPLSERVRAGPEACPARHCWVSDAGARRPGLLVEWRRAETRWEGRVVYATQVRPPAWVLVEEWLPAALLTPM